MHRRTLQLPSPLRGTLLGLALAALAVAAAQDAPLGYEDGPLLPGEKWRVHDLHRPAPPVVKPGERGAPPSDAIVLFDGDDLAAWTTDGADARWAIEGGAMVRYEVQILDSFENRSYSDGQAAALYGQRPPLVNASRAPGEWQSYDIVFRAPRFEGGELTAPARITLLHNGVLVQDAAEFLGATTHRSLARYAAHEPEGPIVLQDHGNPVRFRNVWVRRLEAQ